MRDLLVVGAGPAGLATALHAARAGLDVAVLDRREPPLDKACGEGLMPGAVEALARLGVAPAGCELTGIRYLDGRLAVGADFPAHRVGRGVRRLDLHAALRAAVVAAGVPIERAGVRSVVQEGDAVRVDGLAARHLVAADGLHSPLRRQLGLDRPVRGAPRYGLRRHFAVRPWSSHVEVHWAPTAEAYVTPVGPDCVGLAVLTDRPAPYADLLQRFPELRDRLTGHEASDVLGAGPLRQAASGRVAGRVLLVGDAAGYVDALTGEGVAVALASAEAAVRAVTSGTPEQYERDWQRLSRRYRWLTAAVLAAARRPVLRRRLVPTAALAPAVFRAAVGQLAG